MKSSLGYSHNIKFQCAFSFLVFLLIFLFFSSFSFLVFLLIFLFFSSVHFLSFFFRASQIILPLRVIICPHAEIKHTVRFYIYIYAKCMLLVSDCVIRRTMTEVATMLGLCTTMVHLSCKWNGKLCVCLKKKETKKKSVCVWVCVLLWYICLASGMVSCVYVWKRKRERKQMCVCVRVCWGDMGDNKNTLCREELKQ